MQSTFKTHAQACVWLNFFSTKTYAVSTQKNCLNETVLFSTQNMYDKIYGYKNIYIFMLIYFLYLLPRPMPLCFFF